MWPWILSLWVIATATSAVVVAFSDSERTQATVMGAFGGLGAVVGLLLAGNVLGGADWLYRLELFGVVPSGDVWSPTRIRLLGLAVATVGIIFVVRAVVTLA